MAEQRSFKAARAVLGLAFDRDKRVIIAFAIMPHFLDVEPALAREEGRIDHVHAVRIGAHQARQYSAGNRLHVELGGSTLDLDRD